MTDIKHPDPKLHRNISFVKSALRIIAGFCLFGGSIATAGMLIVLAEVLGIAEELV